MLASPASTDLEAGRQLSPFQPLDSLHRVRASHGKYTSQPGSKSSPRSRSSPHSSAPGAGISKVPRSKNSKIRIECLVASKIADNKRAGRVGNIDITTTVKRSVTLPQVNGHHIPVSTDRGDIQDASVVEIPNHQAERCRNSPRANSIPKESVLTLKIHEQLANPDTEDGTPTRPRPATHRYSCPRP